MPDTDVIPAVHKDHRRERNPPEKPCALVQTFLPKRRETDKVEKAIPQEVGDFLSVILLAGSLGQKPWLGLWIMEARLIRIVDDLLITEYPGEADVQWVRNIVKRVISQKQNPHDPAIPFPP